MGILKSYGRQVRPSGEVGAVAMDVGSAGSGLRSIGAAATGIGLDYTSRKNSAKYAADRSDYQTSLVGLDRDIATARSEAVKNGVPYQDIHSKVVEPLLNKFGTNLQSSGYAQAGAEFASNNWKTDSEKRVAISLYDIEQRENQDILEKNRQGYYLAQNLGNKEDQELFLSQIENMAGPKEANRVKQMGIYNSNVNKMYTLTDPNEITEFINSEEARKMNPAQYQQFRSLGRNHISSMAKEQYAPIKRQALIDIRNNLATPESIKSLDLPFKEKELLLDAVDLSVTKDIELNEADYDSGMKMVDDYLDGKYGKGIKKKAISSNKQYDELLEDLKELNLQPNTLADVMAPIIESQENSQMNYAFFADVNNAEFYDLNVNKILARYRDAHSAANSGLGATQRITGFGNGYRHVMNWVIENKKDIKDGTIPDGLDDVISMAVMPAVERRTKEIAAERSATFLQDEKARADLNKQQLDAIWGE